MNMISTGAFQTEMDASDKQPTLAEKLAALGKEKCEGSVQVVYHSWLCH